jgi:riboflavin-specific deaminase-like protein
VSDAPVNRLWPDPGALDDDGLFEAYRPAGDGPWLRANFVASLDGAAWSQGLSGMLSTPADRRVFGVLRARADAILVGAGTLREEPYSAALVRPTLHERRRRAGHAEHPVLAVVSAGLELDPASPVFAQAHVRPVVLTVATAPAARRAALERVADVVSCGESTVDMPEVLAQLHHRGLAVVLCEGGPKLFGALVAADLVDELCLTLSPLLAGAGAGRIVAGPPIPVPRTMRLTQLLEAGGTLLTRYVRTA